MADTPALDEWLAGLQRDVAVTIVDPGLLTIEHTLQLVRGFGSGALRGTPELERVAKWLFDETRGHPFFAVEILRQLVDRGIEGDPLAMGSMLPPGVRELIRTRLARLARPAREFLAAAAVIGEGFTFDQVCQVGGLAEQEALRASDAVIRWRCGEMPDVNWRLRSAV